MSSSIPSIEALRQLPSEEILRQLFELTAEMPRDGGFPLEIEMGRQRALESPHYLATKIIDPWYEDKLEPRHLTLLDEVLAPWCLGQSVKIEGITYNSIDFTGLLILWPRSTLKSTMLRLLSQWFSLYSKLKLGEDARIAFTHQVIGKATEHSDSIRQIARLNPEWRKHFPEFSPPPSGEWDRVNQWRWPNFTTYSANEWSYIFYGETSSKTGGHYTLRLVDDWVTEESITTTDQLAQSERRFRAMDNLRDRNRPLNPWIAGGTHYHFSDTYARLERSGGWLVWKVPAHLGSARAIFDLSEISDRTESGRKQIEAGLRKLERERSDDLNFPKLLPWRELYRSARAQKSEDGLSGGHNEYNCQLLLSPVPEGEQRFDQDALDAMWTAALPHPDECYLYLRCDPAISEKRTADDLAITLGAVDYQGIRWFLDGWVGREKKPTEQARKMFRMVRKWQAFGYTVKSIGIEATAYQEALAQICRGGVPVRDADFDGEQIRVLKAPCAVVSIHRSPDLRKEERILQMTGAFERREVRLHRDSPIAQRTYDELKQFPLGKKNILDTLRDFWSKVNLPAKPLPGTKRRLHPELRKILKGGILGGDGEDAVAGTNQSVAMSRWGKR